MSSTLFIQHHAPYSNHNSQETLDALLVMATFGQNPSVLFQGDGVWQLVGTQKDAQLFGQNSIVAQTSALELYDVEKVYVDLNSLQQRQLQLSDLAIPAQGLAAQQLSDFIQQHRFIIRL
ncbi:MAG: sulfurtransferase complex subunit TusC [Moraxellaceae bacterium]|nr:sulfurtransferase complex subunit TusC [Moraxellaceae bacterium]